MNIKHHSQGFTLIELVVVIVILGILSVTAAPRFLNLQRDARIAAVEGLEAAVKSAASFAYAKAAIEGVENLPKISPYPTSHHESTPIVETNLGRLELKYGYPEAYAEDGGLDISHLLDLTEDDWDLCYGSSNTSCDVSHNHTSVKIGFGLHDDPTRQCYMRYIEPTYDESTGSGNKEYEIEVITEDC